MAAPIVLDGVVPGIPPERWRHPLSLTVHEGAFIAIRTMPALSEQLFRFILGADQPASGSVSTFGRPAGALSGREVRTLRATIGSVLRPDGLVANMSVWKNITIPLIFASGMNRTQVADRAEEIIESFALGPVASLRPHAVSPDQRQIAALARAVAMNPALLLLDEPLASVGSVDTGPLFALCRQFVPTILAATHRRNTALYESADDVLLWDEMGLRPAAAYAGEEVSA